jgi:hypothetical protein
MMHSSSNFRHSLVLLLWLAVCANAFAPLAKTPAHHSSFPIASSQEQKQIQRQHQLRYTITTTTRLYALLEVPNSFFTITFPMLGILLNWSRGFGRIRMEERAWDMRLEESRAQRLRDDPTLTEIELRRKEAALEWSAYGKPRMDEERAEKERQQRLRELGDNGGGGGGAAAAGGRSSSRRRGVQVLDKDLDDEMDSSSSSRRTKGNDSNSAYRMTDDEIRMFESEHGIDYDPYYDDPYSEDELPDDVKFQVDKKYGDRIYENGEVFYKDKATGMFYRQGAKPRNLSFF